MSHGWNTDETRIKKRVEPPSREERQECTFTSVLCDLGVLAVRSVFHPWLMTDLNLAEMDDDQIHQLLWNADRDAGPPTVAAQLTVVAARKLLAERRHRNRSVVAATAVVLLGCVGLAWRAIGVSRPVSQPDLTVASADAPQDSGADVGGNAAETDLAALAAEAEFHARVARRMIAALNHQKSLEAWQKERALGDPLENIRAELDVTAFRMIARADRIIEQMGERDSAIAIYKDVIRLFPKTLSAGVAHDRLARLEQQQGET